MDAAALALPSPRIMAPGSALNALDDITCFGNLGDLTSFDHAPGGMGVVSSGGGVGWSGERGCDGGDGSWGVVSGMGRGHGGLMMVHVWGRGSSCWMRKKGPRTDPQVFEEMLKVRLRPR